MAPADSRDGKAGDGSGTAPGDGEAGDGGPASGDRKLGDAGGSTPGGGTADAAEGPPSSGQAPPPSGAPARPRRPDELRRKTIHQPKDKIAKAFYGDERMAAELLATQVLGKIVPGALAERVDLGKLSKTQTEYVDPKSRTVRHADLVWRAPLRDSWLYVVFLFEAQSTPARDMAVRILLETALVYAELLARDPEVRKQGKLPPVLPIVVYTGEEPWRGPTRVEDLLADEAQAFLPYALGHQFVLVEEAKVAQALETADTAWTAALRLRYTLSRAEFKEALAKLRKLMPEGLASRALAAWVRRALIEDGAKEEDMENVQELRDLEPVVHSFWGAERLAARREGRAKGREEGRVATLVRQARRKFGAETADGLALLLTDVSGPERVGEIADLIIDCANGADFLAQAARNGQPEAGAAPGCIGP